MRIPATVYTSLSGFLLLLAALPGQCEDLRSLESVIWAAAGSGAGNPHMAILYRTRIQMPSSLTLTLPKYVSFSTRYIVSAVRQSKLPPERGEVLALLYLPQTETLNPGWYADVVWSDQAGRFYVVVLEAGLHRIQVRLYDLDPRRSLGSYPLRINPEDAYTGWPKPSEPLSEFSLDLPDAQVGGIGSLKLVADGNSLIAIAGRVDEKTAAVALRFDLGAKTWSEAAFVKKSGTGRP